jgi:hypothetical protein
MQWVLEEALEVVEEALVDLEAVVEDLEAVVEDLEAAVGDLEAAVGDLEAAVGDSEAVAVDLVVFMLVMLMEDVVLEEVHSSDVELDSEEFGCFRGLHIDHTIMTIMSITEPCYLHQNY